MASEPDAATAALIAQMLREENPYEDADIYGIGDDDSDDCDYGSRKKKKRKKAAPKEPKPAKEPKQPKAPKAPKVPKVPKVPKPPPDPSELTETGRRRRKDAGSVRQKARPWTEEEEVLFREALVVHGRDWKACAAHVGTRDHRAFTSHAQKHFIKLCLQGKPLPKKVAETGAGYTLSGKPLDPNSAAAKQYGFKESTLATGELTPARDAAETGAPSVPEVSDAPVAGDNILGGTAGASNSGVLSPAEMVEMAAAKAAKAEAAAAAAAARDAKARDALERARKAEKARIAEAEKRAARVGVVATAEDGAVDGAAGATEYAKARPKRETAGKMSLSVAGFRDANGGTLELHPLRAFAANTRPGSGDPGAQPFRVVVRPSAQLVMDTHAHLCTNEVIGYLGGAWDAASRTVTVAKAFPGRGLASGSDVEMDPLAEVELKAQVESEGMRVVGWYHSHPVFEPTPSGVDVDNQLNYQNLFAADAERDDAGPARDGAAATKPTRVSPFVGFIVGPYDLRLPTRVSKMTCFVAERRAGRGGVAEDAPFEVRYETTDDAPDDACVEAMCAVVAANADVAGRVRINELWRHFTNIANNKPDWGPCTKLAKLRASLAARLPDTVDEAREEQMLDAVAKHIQTAWHVDLGF